MLFDAPGFRDLAALNTWLEQPCKELWHEIRHPKQTDRTIAEVYADEQPALMAVPPPFDGFIEHAKRVSPACLIVFERNRYTVPAALTINAEPVANTERYDHLRETHHVD